MLTTQQRIEICILKAQFNSTTFQVIETFNQRHPDRPQRLNATSVNRLWRKFLQTGSVEDRSGKGRKSKVDDFDTAVNVLANVFENDRQGIRRLSVEAGVSYVTAQKILKKFKVFPYKAQLHQKLIHGDPPERLRFCQIMQGRIERDPSLRRRIMWSDEANFLKEGAFNRQINRSRSRSFFLYKIRERFLK